MSKIDKIYYLVLPILVLGIPLHFPVTLSCLVSLLFFVLRCVTAERNTLAAFFMLYAGPTIGTIRAIYPAIPVYGAMFSLIGFLLALSNFRSFFKRNLMGNVSLIIVFLYFTFCFIYGGCNEFGESKLNGIFYNGITTLLGFYVLFTSKKLINEQFSHLLILSTIIMIYYIIIVLGVNAGNIFDFNWLRSETYLPIVDKLIGYQHIGMNTAFAYGIFMAKKDLSHSKLIYYTILCFYLALMSGARQGFVATLAIFVFRYLFYGVSSYPKIKLKYIVFTTLTLLLIYNLVYFLNIESFINTFESGDSSRDVLHKQALLLFFEEPIWGQGLGGFMLRTGENYPHNFVLEVLCECGILGAIVLFIICLVFVIKKRISLRIITSNKSYPIIMMIALFIRCMVSDDFTCSIQLFSGLFAMSSLKTISNERNKQYI